MSNNTFAEDLTIARLTVESLNLKGERPAAVKAFLAAETDDERDAVVESYGAGMVRRGLRQIARRFDKTDADLADVFWALRDDIDEEDDTVFRVEASNIA